MEFPGSMYRVVECRCPNLGVEWRDSRINVKEGDGERFNRLRLGGEDREIPCPMFKGCSEIPVPWFMGRGEGNLCGQMLWV